jgi:peptidoglycan hydrolase-like protein with peptidoglycan-binding domain
MTPFRMRMFLAGFMTLATAISFNALYMQEAPRHIAGVSSSPVKEQSTSTAALSDTPAQQDKAVTEIASVTPAVTPQEPTTPAATAPTAPSVAVETPPAPTPLVKSVQRELAVRGYASGRTDGVLTLESRMAIIAYEFDGKLPISGDASEQVLKALIFEKASGITRKAKAGSADRFERRRDVIEQVQQMLAQLGYTSGPIDGQLDDKTRDAIRKFETDRNLKPTGHLTERVLLEMVIVIGHPLVTSS